MERKNRGILKNKLFLYLTEFFSGMSVMAVELGASRLLAPYFSSSQIVWTIIIGTIMIAMALGNIYGGRTADKSPNPDKLYGRIIVAALWIALIPVVGKYIIVGISAVLIFSVNNNFLILAAFVACMVIFVFPLFLLGTVTPSLVKYSVSNLDDNGKNGGNTGSIQYDRQHYWYLCADVCYDPCGWNIDHFSDLCGNFTCVIHRVFCDGKSREKESDCIGTYFRVLLWNRLFRFLRILGKQPDI